LFSRRKEREIRQIQINSNDKGTDIFFWRKVEIKHQTSKRKPTSRIHVVKVGSKEILQGVQHRVRVIGGQAEPWARAILCRVHVGDAAEAEVDPEDPAVGYSSNAAHDDGAAG